MILITGPHYLKNKSHLLAKKNKVVDEKWHLYLPYTCLEDTNCSHEKLCWNRGKV